MSPKATPLNSSLSRLHVLSIYNNDKGVQKVYEISSYELVNIIKSMNTAIKRTPHIIKAPKWLLRWDFVKFRGPLYVTVASDI